MSSLVYRGRSPDSDHSVVNKRYTDQRYDTVRVDAAYISSQIALVTSSLVTPAYVDQQDGFKAAKTAVDAADSGYLLASTLGAANGVAPIASDGYIPAINLPTLQTQRNPTFVGPSQVFLSGSRVVTTINAKEYQVATMTIPDPGYPYYPLCFAMIRGGAQQVTAEPPRSQGTPNYGQVNILASDNTKYGWGICTSRKVWDFHMCLPFADTSINPTTRPPVQGALTLGLWVGLWGGTTFTFDSGGLQFWSINYPAV